MSTGSLQCALGSEILCREQLPETWTNPSVCTSVCGSDLIAGTSMCYPHHPWGKPTVLFPEQSVPVQTTGQQSRCTSLFPSLWELLVLYGSMPAESDTDAESQQLPAQWKFKRSWVLQIFVFLLFCIVFFPFPHHLPFSELFVILQSYPEHQNNTYTSPSKDKCLQPKCHIF